MTSPLELAVELINASATSLKLLAQVSDGPVALITEKADIATWAHLARYFGLKIEAAVALQRFRTTTPPNSRFKDLAVNKLIECQEEWRQIVGTPYGRRSVEKLASLWPSRWIDVVTNF
jgi:hypothetical protein